MRKQWGVEHLDASCVIMECFVHHYFSYDVQTYGQLTARLPGPQSLMRWCLVISAEWEATQGTLQSIAIDMFGVAKFDDSRQDVERVRCNYAHITRSAMS